MAQNKTTVNDASVEAFVESVTAESTRRDCMSLIALMREITGCEARMWGRSIIGFDQYRYRYANGKSGEICLVGFSPRKSGLVLYVTENHERDADLLTQLGKIGTGRACIYMNHLHNVNLTILKRLIRRAVKARRKASISE